MDGNVSAADRLAKTPGIRFGMLKRNVSTNRGEHPHIEALHSRESQQDRHGIIFSRVGVDDKRSTHAGGWECENNGKPGTGASATNTWPVSDSVM